MACKACCHPVGEEEVRVAPFAFLASSSSSYTGSLFLWNTPGKSVLQTLPLVLPYPAVNSSPFLFTCCLLQDFVEQPVKNTVTPHVCTQTHILTHTIHPLPLMFPHSIYQHLTAYYFTFFFFFNCLPPSTGMSAPRGQGVLRVCCFQPGASNNVQPIVGIQ